jgi:hypothetical protein
MVDVDTIEKLGEILSRLLEERKLWSTEYIKTLYNIAVVELLDGENDEKIQD